MMKRAAGLILLMVYASTPGVSGRDLPLTDANEIISQIDERMAQLDSMIFRRPGITETPEFLSWSAQRHPDSVYLASVNAVTDARIGAIKAETGLQLTGQAYYRPDATFGFDDEDDGVSRYTGKIQVEARWYFLQSGLLKRGSRINEQRLKGDIAHLQHERDRSIPELYANREYLRIVSDSILASIMLHRVNNLTMLEDAYTYLLDNENISSDNLLRILDDRAEAERRLSTISTLPVAADHLQYVSAGTIAVDTTAILSALSTTDLDLKIYDLRTQLLECQAQNTTWWSDVRLAPFVRYSHYFRHDMPASANVDVGMSFTIPINTIASQQRKALRAEKAQIDCDRNELLKSAQDKVRYLTLEIERLNRSIAGECQRATALRNHLKMRRDAYARRNGEYNRLTGLMEYNSYLRCLECIVEIQYRRDVLLADLQAMVPATPLESYCSFTPLTF